jgi:predicted ATPase
MQLPFATFHENLRYFRKRLQMTQDDLGLAVGYTREHIARLESGQRKISALTFSALFVPALDLEHQPAVVTQLLALLPHKPTSHSPAEYIPSTQQRIQVVQTAPPPPAPSHSTLTFPPLPARLLPCIGQTDLLARAQFALASQSRLLGLLGAPGIGKTRLALEIAHQALPLFGGLCSWVDLSECSTEWDALQEITARCGLTAPATAQSHWQAWLAWLAQTLPGAPILLVLDGCDSVENLPVLIKQLLAGVPNLTVLYTRQSALAIRGEFRWVVAPLPLPNLHALPPPALLLQNPSVAFLVRCLQSFGWQETVSDANAITLASLVVALDGLPLALELVAAQCQDVLPQAVLRAVVAQRKGVATPQQWASPLHAAIATSFARLSAPQQAIFAALGVFHGWFTAESLQAVFPHATEDWQVVRASGLVQSLPSEDEPIFHLLAPIADFARAQLHTQADWHKHYLAHSHFFGELAGQVFDGIRGAQVAKWNAIAAQAVPNFWAGLEFACQQQDSLTALQIAGNLWWYFYRAGQLRLIAEKLALALALPIPTKLPDNWLVLRGRALNGAGNVANELGDLALARSYFQAALALYGSEQPLGYLTVLHNLAILEMTCGNLVLAKDGMLACAEKMLEMGETPCMEYINLGRICLDLQELTQAEGYARQGLALAQMQEDLWTVNYAQLILADCCVAMGKLKEAQALATSSAQGFLRDEQSEYVYSALLLLGSIETQLREWQSANSHLRQALQYWQSEQDVLGQAMAWFQLAMLEWAEGAVAQAAETFQRANQLRQQATRAQSPREQAEWQAFAGKLPPAQ